ncbi:MAG: hypothetical protein GY730_08865 [bacterium]|nr:hypothetical protein [bacterium]
MRPNNMNVNVPALAEYVSVVRLTASGVASKMNFSLEAIEDIKISVSEACTNVVQYAYKGDISGRIEVNFTIHVDSLEIYVEDKGIGFDYKEAGKKANVSSMNMGLGITFIKTLMDDMEIKSEIGKGTTIRMVKKSPQSSIKL